MKKVIEIDECSSCNHLLGDRVQCKKCHKIYEMINLELPPLSQKKEELIPVHVHSYVEADILPSEDQLYTKHSFKKLIEWGPKYMLGLKEIDDQHYEIVKLINQIHESVNSGVRDHKFVLSVLKQLDAYVSHHFSTEEKIFVATKYPGMDQQKREHRVFSAQVRELHKQFEKSFFDLRSVLRFMVGWFMEHTQGSDRNFVTYWKEQSHKSGGKGE